MKLTMLGVGNGFSPGVYDNNALLESKGSRTLIDCGVTAWESLRQLGLQERDIDTIFITHLHFDHAGGLEAAALHSRHFSHRKIRLLLPEPLCQSVWKEYLLGGLYNPNEGLNTLEDYFDVVPLRAGEPFLLCTDVWATWFRTRHIDGKFSCGLLVKDAFAYTSDMRADLPLVEDLIAQGAAVVLHDCQMKNAVVHADYRQLCAYPAQVREKLLLMHHGMLVPPKNAPIRFLRQHETISFDHAAHHTAYSDEMVDKTIEYIRQLQSKEPTGHDWYHTQRVYQMAMQLARQSEKPLNLRIIALAALLHDIADWKFNGGDEEAGPEAAANWLRQCGADEPLIEHIKTIIRDLSFKGMGEVKHMQSAEGEIVQDADRLDALGAIGIARAFATGANFGNLILDPQLPPRLQLTAKSYTDRNVISTTLNHFYEKLLHLDELMNTPQAKTEAIRRKRVMVGYLQELFTECNMTGGLHQQLLEELCNHQEVET